MTSAALRDNQTVRIGIQAFALETRHLCTFRIINLILCQKLGARSLASQKCPVIFTPRVSGGLFSQLLGALGGSSQYKKKSMVKIKKEY
jgi:PmbA protein